jgi:6-phosphofructokinase 2
LASLLAGNGLVLGMPKIITLTFNPVIDKTTSVNGVAPEKKLRCSQPAFGPGGGGINVTRALRNLDADSLAVYPAGGYSGKFLNDLMQQYGLHFEAVEMSAHTRENFIVFDKATGLQYRFGMPGSEIEESEWKALLEKVRDTDADFIVASGSLLPGMPVDIVAQVAQIAKEKGAKLILDTSGEALKKAVEVGVYLLKPNLGELSSLVGEDEVDHHSVDEIGKEIIRRGECELLVVSMGAKGAKLITKDEIIEVASPVVRSVSTLGAGDSMVAGMVLALSRNKSLKEVLQYGIACGTAATLTHGSELCRKEDVDKLCRLMKMPVEKASAALSKGGAQV